MENTIKLGDGLHNWEPRIDLTTKNKEEDFKRRGSVHNSKKK